MTRAFVAVLLCVAPLGLGCTGSPDAAPESAVRADLTLAAEPLVSIGSVSGEAPYLLSRAYRGRILADSSVLVSDGTELRIYDRDGTWVRTIGREGSGPGELTAPGWIVEDSTGLAVWDLPLRRLTAFSLQGDVLGTEQVASSALPGFPSLVGRLPDRTLVFQTAEGYPDEIPRGSPQHYSVGQMVNTFVLESAAGVDTVLRGPAERRYFARVRPDDPAIDIGTVPLSSRYVADAGSDFVAVGHGDSRYIRVIRTTGRDSVYLDVPRSPVDSDVRDAVSNIEFEDASSEQQRRYAEILLDNMQWPDSTPLIDGLFVASDDRIWARHFSLEPGERWWSIFGPDVSPWARVVIPDSLRVLDARGSRVLTRRTDEFDVPYVDVWRLSNAGEQR